MDNMKRLIFILLCCFLAVKIFAATGPGIGYGGQFTGNHIGNGNGLTNLPLNPGSNVVFAGGANGPLTISAVVPSILTNDGTTVFGITNGNSPLLFPFMGYTYVARFCVISEAWTGLTNGVIHWRGDGANPNQYCTYPREFDFQTNWNWTVNSDGTTSPTNRWLLFSNDVFTSQGGEVSLDVEIWETCYTNTFTGSGVAPQDTEYKFSLGGSNGVTWQNFQTSGDQLVTPTFDYDYGVGDPKLTYLSWGTNGAGSFMLYATNTQRGGNQAILADRAMIHCTEVTTGTNWPYH
jgi:hypothetical protein